MDDCPDGVGWDDELPTPDPEADARCDWLELREEQEPIEEEDEDGPEAEH